MRRFAVAVVMLLGIALAQAWDFEVGREYVIDQGQRSWYVLARYNMPLTSEVLGTQAWLLPELGIWLPDYGPYAGYVRTQFIIDRDFGALFADFRMRTQAVDLNNITTDTTLRIGVRFGWPAK